MTLAVRTPNWIGDCVMIQPALRLLETVYSPDDLILVTRPHLTDLFTPPLVSPHAAHPVVSLPGGGKWREVVSGAGKLRKRGSNRGLLFTNSIASALMFRLAGINRLTGYRRDGRGPLLCQSLEWPSPARHQVDAYMDLAAAASGLEPVDNALPRMDVPRDFLNRVSRLLVDHGARKGVPWIGISPCAAYGTAKEWPRERFRELVQLLSRRYDEMSILLFGGPGDHHRLEFLAPDAAERVVNLARVTTLAESVAAASLCRVFVSNDSGMMHAAAATGTPVVALFGPTDPKRVIPRTPLVKILRRETPCAPCSRRTCDHHDCMRGISVEQVHAAVRDFLAGGEG